MTKTPAEKKAQRTYEQRRRERGERKRSFWLTPAGLEALDRLRAADGSADASVEIAILALDHIRQAKKPTS